MGAKANSKIRLCVSAPLAEKGEVTLDPGQAHYLRTVMRRGTGDKVLLFNGRDGEWAADITMLDRHAGVLLCREQTRAQDQEFDLWLLFAPVKKARLDFIAEKAGELGAGRIMPVFTRFTAVDRVNVARLQENAREAAEQCGRLSVPHVTEPQKLTDVLADWPDDRGLFFADESGGAPFLSCLQGADAAKPWALLVGPEGGFSEDERAALSALPQAAAVHLGPRILRAETAVVAMLTLWQAVLGDWR